MARAKKLAVVSKECVACGTCVGSCPLGAVSIYKGIWARIDPEACVGCGRCVSACPAGVISLREREAAV